MLESAERNIVSTQHAKGWGKRKSANLGYGLILRNLGALCQTLYLAATELELSPCAIGYGNAERFARLTGLDPVVEGSVGEFILGGKALPPRRRG